MVFIAKREEDRYGNFAAPLDSPLPSCPALLQPAALFPWRGRGTVPLHAGLCSLTFFLHLYHDHQIYRRGNPMPSRCSIRALWILNSQEAVVFSRFSIHLLSHPSWILTFCPSLSHLFSDFSSSCYFPLTSLSIIGPADHVGSVSISYASTISEIFWYIFIGHPTQKIVSMTVLLC